MILSGKEIKAQLGKTIHIDPWNEKQLNPNSYNLRLSDDMLVYDTFPLDMKKPNSASPLTIPENGLVMEPNRLYLGRTVEHTTSSAYVPMLEGRSSIGRLGLFVHVTAGFGDVGFSGYWTLEMFCIHPIRIYPDIEICQIYFHSIDGAYELYKSNKYQHNKGIQPSMLYKDFE